MMNNLRTNESSSVKKRETRVVFRVLAGIIAVFLLLIGLPLAVSGAFMDTWWESGLWAIGCVYAGIGLAIGARTGRWYSVRA
jgi:hypothetical protein